MLVCIEFPFAYIRGLTYKFIISNSMVLMACIAHTHTHIYMYIDIYKPNNTLRLVGLRSQLTFVL